MTTSTGRCLCGAVTFTATPRGGMHACHCDTCRRLSGGILFSVDCGDSVEVEVREHDLRVPREAHVRRRGEDEGGRVRLAPVDVLDGDEGGRHLDPRRDVPPVRRDDRRTDHG